MELLTCPHAGGQVSDLIAFIKSATHIIESHYLKSSLPDIPSLDSLVPHPLDSTVASPQFRNAVQLLEGASAQLCATLARPNHTILNRALQFFEPACLSVVTAFKIPDILQEHPSGMHVKKIGERAGVNHEKLCRIMRLLATKHIFREVAEDCFANNRLSLQLLSSNPLTNMISHFTEEQNKATSMLVEVLADPEWGNSQTPERSPWNRLTGFEGSIFQYYEGASPEGAKKGASFGIAMSGWDDVVQSTGVLSDFPWQRYPPGTIVNDVGGGVGGIAMGLLKAYPNLQLRLQDLPERIRQAETQIWPKLLPSAITEKRIEFKAMDFFAGSPIEGCDVYYLKNIMHDWPDKECIQILQNIRTVLKPGACVLIHEYVIQHAHRNNISDSEEAPEPLLPNYGLGRIRQYNLDIGMMVIQNGRERTLEDFIDIASKADLQFVKLWSAGEMDVVEFQPAMKVYASY